MKTSNTLNSAKSATSRKLQLVISLFAISNIFGLNSYCLENTLNIDCENNQATSLLIETSLKSCESNVFWMEGIELESAPLIYSFYKKNNFTPLWTNYIGVTKQSKEIISLFKDAYKYGLDFDNYYIAELEKLCNSIMKFENVKKSARARASFEFLMTNSVFNFMLQISKGSDYSFKSHITDIDFPFIQEFPVFLTNILNSTDIKADILKLQPENDEYMALQNEIEIILRNINPADNSFILPDINDNDNTYKLFNYMLSAIGVSKESASADATVMLIEFQKNSGLRGTGKFDAATCKELTNTIIARYELIVNELDKIRNVNSLQVSSLNEALQSN